MNTTETRPICLEQPWDKYISDAEQFVKIKKLVYKASQRAETLRAYKRTGDHLYFSTRELDEGIKRWEYIHSRLKAWALSKAINLITQI